jgi:hypothetical protein
VETTVSDLEARIHWYRRQSAAPKAKLSLPAPGAQGRGYGLGDSKKPLHPVSVSPSPRVNTPWVQPNL